jgi:hypothetical protein
MNIIKLIVVAVVILLYIAYHVYVSYYSESPEPMFPPFISKCPDYWEVTDKDKCKNVNKIGICLHGGGRKDDNVMDFDIPIFKGKKGLYYKCSWANKCKTPWEGIDKLCV